MDDRAMQVAQVFVILCVTGGHPIQTFQARISFDALLSLHTWLFTKPPSTDKATGCCTSHGPLAAIQAGCVACLGPRRSASPWMHFYVGAYRRHVVSRYIQATAPASPYYHLPRGKNPY